MKQPTDRADFAWERPLPPFGSIVNWLIEVLQLQDPLTYMQPPSNPEEARSLQRALSVIDGGTMDNVADGLIVKEETKRMICTEVLAPCIRLLRGLPFKSVPHDKFSEWLYSTWKEYEVVSNRLSALAGDSANFQPALLRHVTLELAVRAGAVAALCGDAACSDVPRWSRHTELKKWLRKQFGFLGTRDELSDKLGRSKAEVDRWLDDLDIPGSGDIHAIEKSLADHTKNPVSRPELLPLWRLYVGRRMFTSVQQFIPKSMRGELLEVYGRIRRLVCEHYFEQRGSANQAVMALAVTGRIRDTSLGIRLLQQKHDQLWGEHIQAVCLLEGAPSPDVVQICQLYSTAASAVPQADVLKDISLLDKFVRFYLSKRQSDSSFGELIRLVTEAQQSENRGEYSHAAIMLERVIQLWPRAANWDSLGRMRLKEGRTEEAEKCYRTALNIAPSHFDARLDLALLLANTNRPAEAITELDTCSTDEKNRSEWLFARAKALLGMNQPKQAIEELQKCINAGFKVGNSYRLMALGWDALCKPSEARECRKRAAELLGQTSIK